MRNLCLLCLLIFVLPLKAEKLTVYKHVNGQVIEWSKFYDTKKRLLDSIIDSIIVNGPSKLAFAQYDWYKYNRKGIYSEMHYENEIPVQFGFQSEVSDTFHIQQLIYKDDCSILLFSGYLNKNKNKSIYINSWINKDLIERVKKFVKTGAQRIEKDNMKENGTTTIYMHHKGVKSKLSVVTGNNFRSIHSKVNEIISCFDDIFSLQNNTYQLLDGSFHEKHDTVYEMDYFGCIDWCQHKMMTSHKNKVLIDSQAESFYIGVSIGQGYLYFALQPPGNLKRKLLSFIKSFNYVSQQPLRFTKRLYGDEKNDCTLRWWKNDSIYLLLVCGENIFADKFNVLIEELNYTPYQESLYYPMKKEYIYSQENYSKYRKTGCIEIIFNKGFTNIGVQGILIPTYGYVDIRGIYEEFQTGAFHLYAETAFQKSHIDKFREELKFIGRKSLPDTYVTWQNYIRYDDTFVSAQIPKGFIKPGTYRSWEDLVYPADSLKGTYIYEIEQGNIKNIRCSEQSKCFNKMEEWIQNEQYDTVRTEDKKRLLKEITNTDYKLIFFSYGIKLKNNFISFGILISNDYSRLIHFDYKARTYDNRIYHITPKNRKRWVGLLNGILNESYHTQPFPHPERRMPFTLASPLRKEWEHELNEYMHIDSLWQSQGITPLPQPQNPLRDMNLINRFDR